jgi:hypothetical protein
MLNHRQPINIDHLKVKISLEATLLIVNQSDCWYFVCTLYIYIYEKNQTNKNLSLQVYLYFIGFALNRTTRLSIYLVTLLAD